MLRRVVGRSHIIYLHDTPTKINPDKWLSTSSLSKPEFETYRNHTSFLLRIPKMVLDEILSVFTRNVHRGLDDAVLVKAFGQIISDFKHQLLQTKRRKNQIVSEIPIEYHNKQTELLDAEALGRVFVDESFVQEGRHVLRSLYLILHFLDRANLGFLSGDLSSQVISLLGKELDAGNMDYDSILAKVMAQLSGNNFKMPEHGILDPRRENQANLFERQLLLEKTSFEITWAASPL